MNKKGVIILLMVIIALPLVSAQTSYSQFSDKTCDGNSCTTKIYSYERYFQRNGNWEEINENWYNCGNNFCTRNYWFNVTADNSGNIISKRGNNQLSMRLNGFLSRNLNFNPIMNESVLVYQDILPNIDLQYQYLPRKLKEEIVIKERLRDLPRRDFEISFMKSGSSGFSFLPSTICDSNNTCEFIEHTINENEIKITIPIDFLEREKTQYPVIIDPTLILNDSFVSWNGYIENRTNSSGNFYTRTSNPSSKLILFDFAFEEGITKNHAGGIEFNVSSILDGSTIYNATLQVYLSATDFLGNIDANIRVMEMEGTSNDYVDENSLCGGNCNFFFDMRNGSVYNETTYSPGLKNFTLVNNASNDLKDSLLQDIFPVGLYTTTGGGDIDIKSRDNSDKSKRPVLTVLYELNSTDANQAIGEGINNALPGNTINSDQQIYLVNENGEHYLGTFDKTTEKNNQTWAFSYVAIGESFLNFPSLFNILNVWENSSLSYSEIVNQVEAFIQ
jgi:hypothetical protein